MLEKNPVKKLQGLKQKGVDYIPELKSNKLKIALKPFEISKCISSKYGDV